MTTKTTTKTTTISELNELALAHPALSFFFSFGRLHVERVRYSCALCGCENAPAPYDGCLGFEGLKCPSCGFMDDANEDGNRAAADEHGRGGALYRIRFGGV